MNYDIIGGAFPAVKCMLQKGEAMKCEGGSMSWMDRGLEMSTEGGGGLGRALGRALSGEKIFFNRFACKADQGEIVFSSSFPGCIIPIQLQAGQTIIAQKDAFLACEESVDVSVHVHEKIGGGLFGGLGFIMQKFTGPGMVFLEIDGALEKYELAPGQVKVIDGPHLAIMGSSVKFHIHVRRRGTLQYDRRRSGKHLAADASAAECGAADRKVYPDVIRLIKESTTKHGNDPKRDPDPGSRQYSYRTDRRP